ncbi:hypothetical protein BT69DRAFT_1283860 [Atractiella rhizophila]|nr:hypothetical protein BT69DRAFT_1283860 [Atractiella rhizophila]
MLPPPLPPTNRNPAVNSGLPGQTRPSRNLDGQDADEDYGSGDRPPVIFVPKARKSASNDALRDLFQDPPTPPVHTPLSLPDKFSRRETGSRPSYPHDTFNPPSSATFQHVSPSASLPERPLEREFPRRPTHYSASFSPSYSDHYAPTPASAPLLGRRPEWEVGRRHLHPVRRQPFSPPSAAHHPAPSPASFSRQFAPSPAFPPPPSTSAPRRPVPSIANIIPPPPSRHAPSPAYPPSSSPALPYAPAPVTSQPPPPPSDLTTGPVTRPAPLQSTHSIGSLVDILVDNQHKPVKKFILEENGFKVEFVTQDNKGEGKERSGNISSEASAEETKSRELQREKSRDSLNGERRMPLGSVPSRESLRRQESRSSVNGELRMPIRHEGSSQSLKDEASRGYIGRETTWGYDNMSEYDPERSEGRRERYGGSSQGYDGHGERRTRRDDERMRVERGDGYGGSSQDYDHVRRKGEDDERRDGERRAERRAEEKRRQEGRREEERRSIEERRRDDELWREKETWGEREMERKRERLSDIGEPGGDYAYVQTVRQDLGRLNGSIGRGRDEREARERERRMEYESRYSRDDHSIAPTETGHHRVATSRRYTDYDDRPSHRDYLTPVPESRSHFSTSREDDRQYHQPHLSRPEASRQRMDMPRSSEFSDMVRESHRANSSDHGTSRREDERSALSRIPTVPDRAPSDRALLTSFSSKNRRQKSANSATSHASGSGSRPRRRSSPALEYSEFSNVTTNHSATTSSRY